MASTSREVERQQRLALGVGGEEQAESAATRRAPPPPAGWGPRAPAREAAAAGEMMRTPSGPARSASGAGPGRCGRRGCALSRIDGPEAGVGGAVAAVEEQVDRVAPRAPQAGRRGGRATCGWPPPATAAARPPCAAGAPRPPRAGHRRRGPPCRRGAGSAWRRPGRRRESGRSGAPGGAGGASRPDAADARRPSAAARGEPPAGDPRPRRRQRRGPLGAFGAGRRASRARRERRGADEPRRPLRRRAGAEREARPVRRAARRSARRAMQVGRPGRAGGPAPSGQPGGSRRARREPAPSAAVTMPEPHGQRDGRERQHVGGQARERDRAEVVRQERRRGDAWRRR